MRLPTFRLPSLPPGAVESLQRNWLKLIAIIFIVVIVLGYIYFYATFVNPALDTRNKLASQINEARSAAQARGILPESPDSLQARLNSIRATLVKSSQIFLTEAQISEYVKRLYLYADESRVSIVDLQTTVRVGITPPTLTPTATRVLTPTTVTTRTVTPPPTIPGQTAQPTALLSPTPTRPPASPTSTWTPTPTRPPQVTPGADTFRLTTVRLNARGSANQLIEFVARIRETMTPGVILNGLTLEEGEKNARLTLELVMVSAATPVTVTPRPPAPAPTQVPVIATPSFTAAPPPTTVYPTPTSTPTATATLAPTFVPQTTYVVRPGDTLFSIARRYNTTVEAIMAANRLPNYNIYVGQVLIIPR